MKTFPATRYVDYWNREWPNKHLWNCLFTFSFRSVPPRGTRETWSMLQAGVEALSPPRGSSIIGIKKGEAPLLMSRPPSPPLLSPPSPRKWKMEVVPRAREGCRWLELYIGWGSRVYRWICLQSGVNLLAAFPQFVRKMPCSIPWKLIMKNWYTIKVISTSNLSGWEEDFFKIYFAKKMVV